MANDPADISPKRQVGDDAAVGMTEENQVVDTDMRRCGGLLGATQRGHFRTGDSAVAAPCVPVSDQAVCNLNTLSSERGNRASRTEINIIRVCGHDQQSFDVGRSKHVGQPNC
ncbi:unannotated protein [freshwater metagenome]|uniref:Unannotated protein n=1 Tax=freshwater metagenome TaxID=449393 RepID=A0A6J7C7Q8_9ZZZZ